MSRWLRHSSSNFAGLFAVIVAVIAACLALSLGTPKAWADEEVPQLKINNGHFEPANLTIPAKSPIKLKVLNSGDSAIEFESFELNRERVVPPGQAITVFLPALDPGTYHFFDDFHHETGQGTLVAK
jgi:hypothetical protein